MSDIYEQKANKYKYKYLKLKKKYIAEGGDFFSDLARGIFGPTDQQIQYEKQRKKIFESQLESDKEKRRQLPPGQLPPGQLPPGQLPPGQLPPRLVPHGLLPPRQPPQQGLLPPRQLQPRQLPLLGIEEQFRIEQEKRRQYQQPPQQGQQFQIEQEKRRQYQQPPQQGQQLNEKERQEAVQRKRQEQLWRQEQETRLQEQERQLAEKERKEQIRQQQLAEKIQQEQQLAEKKQKLQQRENKINNKLKEPAMKKIIINNNNINYNFEFIGEGGYGCVISPPLRFNDTIYIKNHENINDDELNKIFTNNDYVGKLLSCDEAFIKEYKDFLELDEIDKDANHRSKLIFAGYMSNKDIVKKLKELYNDIEHNITKETKDNIKKLYNCFIDPRKIIYNYRSENYGYIISTRVGKSFIEVLKSNYFDSSKIIIILKNLKESFGDIIKKLYDDESIHGDIKFDNMTIDNKLKIYFIDFGFKQKYNILDTLITINHIYPYILHSFFIIKNKYKEGYSFTKLEFIKELEKIELERKRNKDDNPLITPIMQRYFNNININYSFFFHSLQDNIKYPLIEFYTKYIKPISRNIDIYALSLHIYILFNNIYSDLNPFTKDRNTLNILNELLINALYNNIDGPDELIIYIDAIINSIEYNKNTIIYELIKERRNNLEPKIPFYHYYFNNRVISLLK
jgi:tRNA A-37 threonylcarbamoyl transferase component Bud32